MEKIDVYSLASLLWNRDHSLHLPSPHLHFSMLEGTKGLDCIKNLFIKLIHHSHLDNWYNLSWSQLHIPHFMDSCLDCFCSGILDPY